MVYETLKPVKKAKIKQTIFGAKKKVMKDT